MLRSSEHVFLLETARDIVIQTKYIVNGRKTNGDGRNYASFSNEKTPDRSEVIGIYFGYSDHTNLTHLSS